MKTILILLLAVFIFTLRADVSLAQGEEIECTSESCHFIDSERKFLDKLFLIPGQKEDDSLTILNLTPHPISVELVLSSRDQELFRYLTLLVFKSDVQVIAESLLSLIKDEKSIMLGQIPPSQKQELKAELVVDQNLPNEYQGSQEKLDVSFKIKNMSGNTPLHDLQEIIKNSSDRKKDLLISLAVALVLLGLLVLGKYFRHKKAGVFKH